MSKSIKHLKVFFPILFGFFLLFTACAWFVGCDSTKKTEKIPTKNGVVKVAAPSNVRTNMLTLLKKGLNPISYFNINSDRYFIVSTIELNSYEFQFKFSTSTKFGVCDTSGNFLIPMNYSCILAPNALADEILEVADGNTWGFYCFKLKKFIKPQFDLLMPDMNGGFFALKNGNWGHCTPANSFEFTPENPTPAQFEKSSNFSVNDFPNGYVNIPYDTGAFEGKSFIPNSYYFKYNGWNTYNYPVSYGDYDFNLNVETYLLKQYPALQKNGKSILGFFQKFIEEIDETRGPSEIVFAYSTQNSNTHHLRLLDMQDPFSTESIEQISDNIFVQKGIYQFEDFDDKKNPLLAGPCWNIFEMDKVGNLTDTKFPYYSFLSAIELNKYVLTSNWYYFDVDGKCFKNNYPNLDYFKLLYDKIFSTKDKLVIINQTILDKNIAFIKEEIKRLEKENPKPIDKMERVSDDEIQFLMRYMSDAH